MNKPGGENLSLASLFGQLNRIMTVCPNAECGELFYLAEANPYPTLKQERTIIDRIRAEESKLENLEQQLARAESALREKAARLGLSAAKKALKSIDPVFSGSGYDPQDVKVLFDPITYIVFDGLAERSVKRIVLLSDPAEDRETEQIHRSIESSVRAGNIEFQTMRVDDSGIVTVK